ncbi:hypothetical protein ACQP00_19595 [Dactylosporangium sp. CS-047395]|uniref:P-type ATPase n=1 Tax=Dactylosporangium sp. CS-047395 TaxID=3239936 RepID=UPI003D94A1D8
MEGLALHGALPGLLDAHSAWGGRGAGCRVEAPSSGGTSGPLPADEAALIGESLPVTRESGDELSAGTVTATIRGVDEVDRPGAFSALGRIAALVAGQPRRPTPLQCRLAGRPAGGRDAASDRQPHRRRGTVITAGRERNRGVDAAVAVSLALQLGALWRPGCAWTTPEGGVR